MKILKQIFKKILLALYMWYWIIPISFNVLAFAGYFLLMYLIYGSLQVSEINNFLEGHGISTFVGFFVPFGIPCFLALGAMFGLVSPSSLSSIDQAIDYRNRQMGISTPKEAAEILQKTSTLDAMKVYGHMDVMKSANQGFNAKYGTSSPTTVFKDMVKK